MAAMASATGGIRSAMHVSWRPGMENVSISPVVKLNDVCGLLMLLVGLTAMRKTSGLPLDMPPLIPPEPFVAVWPRSSMKQSLCCEPFMAAALNPSPNSMPRIPGIENARWAICDSSESKKGSPRPTGTLSQIHSITPPIESPSLIVASIRGSICAASLISTPAISFIVADILTDSSSFLATTPAATRHSVMRPENCPPPRRSFQL